MKAAISVSGHKQAVLVSSTNGTQLKIKFELDIWKQHGQMIRLMI